MAPLPSFPQASGRRRIWRARLTLETRGQQRGGRLHRHLVLVTHLSNRILCRLAQRAGYGRIVKFKLVRSGAMAARYVGKYVAKADTGLAAWPSRTRWAQTSIKVRRNAGRWLVERFPHLTSERAVLARFDARLAWPVPTGVATHGEVWSPLEDGAWAPRPPPREPRRRLSGYSRITFEGARLHGRA